MSLQIQEQHHLPQTTHSIIGSWRMEQLNISLKTIHDIQRLVEGKISLDEDTAALHFKVWANVFQGFLKHCQWIF